MTRLLVLVGLALLALCLAVSLEWSDAPPDAGLAGGARSDAVGLAAGLAADGVVATEDDEEGGIPTRETVHVAPVQDGVTLRGRCVHGDVSEPVAGASLHLAADLTAVGAEEFAQASRWTAPSSVTTAADGTFAFRVRPTDWPLRLVAADPWCPPADTIRLLDELRWDVADVRDVGDVRLERGYRVAGQVVDVSGRLVDGAYLEIGEAISRIVAGRFDCGSVREGRFPVSMLCDAGEVVEPRLVDVGPGHDTAALRLVAHLFPAVEGVVVDEHGRPAPDFRFAAEWFDAAGTSEVRTDEEGRFRLASGELATSWVRFRRGDTEEGTRRLVETDDWAKVPGPPVTLHTRPRPSLRAKLRVVWESGEPLSDYRLTDDRREDVRRAGPLHDGVATFEGLTETRVRVHVVPSHPGGMRFGPFEIDADAQGATVQTITLPDMAPFEVDVNFETLAEGQRVRLFASLGRRVGKGLESVSLGRIEGRELHLQAPRVCAGWVVSVRAHVGATFVDGVHVPASSYHRDVTLSSAHQVSRRLRVTFAAPATARLDLAPAGGLAKLPKTFLADLLAIRRQGESDVRRDPTLRFDGIEPGTWEVLHLVDKEVWTGRSTSPVHVRRPERVLAHVHLEPGAHRVVEVRLPECEPGRITGSVRHRGAALPHTELLGRPLDGVDVVSTSTDASGRFDTGWILPGRYRFVAIRLVEPGITDDRRIELAEAVEVRPGATIDVDLATSARSLLVQVLDADGRPLGDRWLFVGGYGTVLTDGSGRFVLQPAPSGSCEVLLRQHPGEPSLAADLDCAQSSPAVLRLRSRPQQAK